MDGQLVTISVKSLDRIILPKIERGKPGGIPSLLPGSTGQKSKIQSHASIMDITGGRKFWSVLGINGLPPIICAHNKHPFFCFFCARHLLRECLVCHRLSVVRKQKGETPMSHCDHCRMDSIRKDIDGVNDRELLSETTLMELPY